MAIRIQLRRDTAANWVSSNPVLRQGEMGIETDTLKIKLGDGTSTWTQITGYMNLVPDGNNVAGDYVLASDIGAAEGVVGLDNNKNAIVTGSSIIVEGSTDNSFETTLTVTNPTADRTITFKNADGTVAFTTDIPSTTDSLSEGSTNKYFTDERAQDATADALAAGTHTNITVTYNDAANSISLAAAPGYVDEQAVDAVAAALAAGTHTNITVGYNDSGNAISLTGAVTYTDENAQDAIGNAVGTGLSYNDTTGSISVDTTAIQARVTDVSDTEIGYLNGVTSAIQTQLNAKAASADIAELAQDAVGTILSSDLAYNDSTPGIGLNYVTVGNTLLNGVSGSSYGLIGTSTYLDVKDTNGYNKEIELDITAVETKLETDGFAKLASPTFTGTVTLPGLPTLDLHAATKLYVDNVAAGINFHEAVHAASTVNSPAIYNNGTNGVGATLTADTNRSISVLDGETVVLGQRILIKNQTDAKQNGIYTLTNAGSSSAPWVLTRATDADNNPSGEMKSGDFVFVQNGAVNGSIGFINNSTASPIVIGTDNITYVEFNAGKGVTAGNGLSEATPGTLSINTGITADLNTAQTLTNKTLTSPVINTPTGITKSDVGLANVDNTTDAGKPVSTATQTALDLKAPLANPTFTGTVSGITKTMVGLGNVDNTTDAGKPVSTATQTALDAKVSTAGGSIITASADAIKPLILKQFSGNQTGNLFEAQLATTTVVAALKPNGSFYTGSAASAITARLAVSTNTASNPGVIIRGVTSQSANLQEWQDTSSTVLSKIDASGNLTAASIIKTGGTSGQFLKADGSVDSTSYLSGTVATTSGGTGLTSYTTGDLLYSSASNTLAKLAAGSNGQILTLAAGVPTWAAAPITLPTQTGNSGKYLTTDGTSATWGTLVVPISTGTVTVNQNTAQDVDTTALSAFTSIEYMVSIKQGSKTRTSKVILQTDGTSVDMTEFAITETGGTLAGVVVSATTASSNGKLQVTVTDALSTNATVKFSKVAL